MFHDRRRLGAILKPFVSGVTTTTWDPAHTDALTTLSGGFLTATAAQGSFAPTSTRSIASHSTGKFFSQHTFTAANARESFDFIGVGNASVALNANVGANANNDSIGWGGDGSVQRSDAGAPLATIQTWTTGTVISQAVDLDNMKIWWASDNGNWNNSGTANPATNTGGLTILGTGPFFVILTSLQYVEASPQTVSTSNFGGSVYSRAVPSLFGNW